MTADAYVLCPVCGEEIDRDPDAYADYYADEYCETCQEEAEESGVDW